MSDPADSRDNAPRPPANRRASRRQKPRGYVRLECRAGAHGLGPNCADRCLDLSESGASLVARLPLGVGQEVEIRLTGFGLQTPIKRAAVVRWVVEAASGAWTVGVRFQAPIPYRQLQAIALA